MWHPSAGDCDCYKECKFDKYLDFKHRSCKKYLLGKFVLPCEDELLNTNET